MAGVRFDPAGALRGTLNAPPDKSISHRAAIVAAMCEGETRIEGYLDAADTRATLAAIRALGAEVEESPSTPSAEKRQPMKRISALAGGLDLRVRGVGLRGAASTAPGRRPGRGSGGEAVPIDVGNAGTLLRLLPGWLAGQEAGEWTLDGDESISRRPVDRIVEPLRAMGAELEARDGRLPPLRVAAASLRGREYRMPVASAQVKSCVLLAGLLARGETTVVEPAPTRDHTEHILRAAGASVSVAPARTPVAIRGKLAGSRITVTPAAALRLERLPIPADLSSAAFALAAALVVPGSEVTAEGVGLNPTRVGLLGILNRMGAHVEVRERPELAGEPRGSVTARHGSPLEGARVGAGEVPLAIDELPLVALLGCFAEGETVLSGAQELRHKESDRIAAVVDGLRGLGAEIEATEDGFAVRGQGGLRGGVIDSRGDHRMAMLGAIAGLASRDGVEVKGFAVARVSYPGFERDLRELAAGGR